MLEKSEPLVIRDCPDVSGYVEWRMELQVSVRAMISYRFIGDWLDRVFHENTVF